MRFLVVSFAISLVHPLGAQRPSGPVMPIAIERRLAAAAGLRVGDTVRVSAPDGAAQVARVAAIYEPRADPATLMRRDWHVRLHLADLATLLGRPDQVDRIGIALRPAVNPDSAAEQLSRTAFGYELVPSRQLAQESSTTFLVVSRFHRAIAIISVLASTIFLLCLMLLRVDQRRRDVAMLRFSGISRRTIVSALVLEATAMAIIGSLFGVVIALAAGRAVNLFYQHLYQTSLRFSEVTLRTLTFAVVIAMLLGIAAGALAAWRLVRVPPVALWRRAT